jgi:chaperone modulatory protein CbpM
MITMEEALQRLDAIVDRITLENYIQRAWVRPIEQGQIWYFEEIDIARIQLVHHLRQDILVNDEGMDVVLRLLDQVYDLRERMRTLQYAIERQPPHIQAELCFLLKETSDKYTDV